jgi:hypothetical protein
MGRPRLPDDERERRLIASRKKYEDSRKESNPSFSVKVSKEFLERIDSATSQLGVSRRQLILNSIEFYLDALEKTNQIE